MKRVACLVYENFQIQDIAGPASVFEIAGYFCPPGYAIEMLSAQGGLVTSSCGMAVDTLPLNQSSGCDILLVPGGHGAREWSCYKGLLRFIREAAADGRHIASICTGAFILADAGLLTGRKVATHWAEATELTRLYPDVEVDANKLYINDANIWSSAGVTAGIDLALALIEGDCGHKVAQQVAQTMVVPFKRYGATPQLSTLVDITSINAARPDDRCREVLAWARQRLNEPLSVEHLAQQADLSVRQFSRRFTAAIGLSPAKAIERLRLECALGAVESGMQALDQVALQYGFNNPDRMRRAFIRFYGETPSSIRRRARAY